MKSSAGSPLGAPKRDVSGNVYICMYIVHVGRKRGRKWVGREREAGRREMGRGRERKRERKGESEREGGGMID